MSYASLALVVVAAFLHAGWNLLAKRSANVGAPFIFAYNLVACIAYAPWAAHVLITRTVHWTLPALGIVIASAVIHLGYSLSLQRGYRVANLSVVYPIARGTGPLLATLAAVMVLAERPSVLALIGLMLVTVGIVLIATHGDLRALARSDARTGVRWGMATGGLIAGYTVVDAYAVKVAGVAPIVLDWLCNLFRFIVLAPMILSRPRHALMPMRGHWPSAIAVGLMSPLGYILVLAALDGGAPLSIVAPMREMSMMIATLLGMVVLGEPVGRSRLIGCAVLLGGVVLLAS